MHTGPKHPPSGASVLAKVREHVVPAIEARGAISAWIVDDTGFPKKGKHSVGVARQYCGQLGKQDNCQVAVSLTIANDHASLPVAYALHLPESWAHDRERRGKVGVLEDVTFKTKPQIAPDHYVGAGHRLRIFEAPAFPKIDARAALPVRTARHVPDSIATLRHELAVGIATRLARCPCCAKPASAQRQWRIAA